MFLRYKQYNTIHYKIQRTAPEVTFLLQCSNPYLEIRNEKNPSGEGLGVLLYLNV